MGTSPGSRSQPIPTFIPVEEVVFFTWLLHLNICFAAASAAVSAGQNLQVVQESRLQARGQTVRGLINAEVCKNRMNEAWLTWELWGSARHRLRH